MAAGASAGGDTRRRVKLYLLNDDGQWDDRGTGHISCQYSQELQGFGLFLRSEADNVELLGQRIVSEDIYQHQNETIITWTDPASNADYALSFQENEGCNEMWEQILNVQGRQGGGIGPSQPDPGEVDAMQLLEDFELPEATAGNLEKIAELVTECFNGPPQRREALSMRLVVGSEGGAPGAQQEEEGDEEGEKEKEQEQEEQEQEQEQEQEEEGGRRMAAAVAAAAAAGADLAGRTPVERGDDRPQDVAPAATAREDTQDGAAERTRDGAAEENVGAGRAYVMQLIAVFHECELTENEEQLAALYRIFKGILFLNDPPIIEMLLGEDIVMDVMGILETDPDLHASQRTPHREVLKHGQGLFKEVVQIKDSAIRDKIRQTILLGYLKDTVLPRTIEDATLNTLSTMIYFNQVEIVNTLHQDAEYVSALFAKMQQDREPKADPNGEGYTDAVRLLQELCNMAKHLQSQPKTVFYQVMVDAGLFGILERTLTHDDPTLRAGSTDMLHLIVLHDPGLLRKHLLSQNPRVFFRTLVDRMAHDPVEGVQGQLVELIRSLIDVETMSETADEKDAFLDEFYRIFMELLDTAWPRKESGTAAEVTSRSAYAAANRSKAAILDLLSYCAQHHSYRIRYCILSNSIIQRVTVALSDSQGKRKEGIAGGAPRAAGVMPVLACIGFFRVIVGTKDEFYLRYLVKNSLFEPIVSLLVRNGSRYNLLNSALLELFEFIRTENIKTLISHLVENKDYREVFEKITYVQTFKGLILKYEQANDDSYQRHGEDQLSRSIAAGDHTVAAGPRGPPSVAVGGMIGGAGRGLDRSEEDYFNEDSDDEDEDLNEPTMPLPRADSNSPGPGPQRPGRTGTASPSPNALHDLAGAYAGAESDEDDQEQGENAADKSEVSAATERTLKRDRGSGEGFGGGGNGNDDADSCSAQREEDRASSKKFKPNAG